MERYDNPADLDSEGIPVLEEPVNEDEGMMPPRDYPVAADDYGVTAADQEVDEPLAQRVLREEPDPGRQPGTGRGGGVEPATGEAAEEAAMRIVP